MMKQQITRQKKSARSFFLFMLAVLFFGCASFNAADVKEEEPRRIVDLIMSEDSESVNITIKGNKYLSYSALTQDSPKGVIFNFSDTALGNIDSVYTPAENDIISSIETNERVGDKTTKTSIFIGLKQDTSYDVIPQDEGLRISFPKPSAISKETILQEELAKKKPEPTIPPISTPSATRLEDVMVTSLEDNVVVNIKADGVIRDYDSFTLNNPARIVFDMHHLKSPYENEQKIAVPSKWVNQVRHCMHSDKVRLVIDTYRDYLSNYAASPTQNGLLINVGSFSKAQTE
jgi:type IV pilus assembly protein PilQ